MTKRDEILDEVLKAVRSLSDVDLIDFDVVRSSGFMASAKYVILKRIEAMKSENHIIGA
jgi:hypothetical protein